MKDSQITALFMALAILATALALYRQKALGLKTLAAVFAGTAVVAGFVLTTLGD